MPPIPLEEVACNLCSGRRTRVLYHRPYALDGTADCAATTDHFHDYGRIVRCIDCGLVYTDPRPSRAALLAGYGACADPDYLAESSSRSINAHLSLNVIKRFVPSGKLLEVGASLGYFLNAARADFDVSGLEPSRWACGLARERFKLDVACGSIESAELPAGAFDVVAMVDVIEHLADPRAALAAARRALHPGGLLYLVTPDIGSLSAWLLGRYWWGLRPAHVYYFDQATMGRLLRETGFDVRFEKSFGRIFSLRYWAGRFKSYPGPLRAALDGTFSALGLEDKLVYVDTRDSMELCAVAR